MPFDRFKAFRADHMLDAAGVLCGDFRGNAEADEPVGEKLVPFIDHLRDGASAFRESDEAFLRHYDVLLFSQVFHGHADAGFLKAKLLGDVHGADCRALFAQDQYRFQIVLSRFVYMYHTLTLILSFLPSVRRAVRKGTPHPSQAGPQNGRSGLTYVLY